MRRASLRLWRFCSPFFVVLLALTTVTSVPLKSAAAEPVSVSFFYDSLEPDGRWVEHHRYGRVWYPTRVADDWRPYTRGRWVWTEDYGWYWQSAERFGWATYHYGRWDLDEDYGWIWIPGDEWGPAWVDWREGGGTVGWAPLPPAVVWRDSRFDYGGVDLVSVRYRPIWCFVPTAAFVSYNVYNHVLPPARNVTIINNTTNISNYTVVNNTIINKSVNITRIENATRTTIKPVRVIQAATPAMVGLKGTPRTALLRKGETQLAVFKPEVRPGQRPPGINPAPQAQTLKLPPGGLAKTTPAPAPASPAPLLNQSPARPAQAAVPPTVDPRRMRSLERVQAREAASQQRSHVVERVTSVVRPRPDLAQRQAAERQELKRIQDGRRAVVQNRAAIAQQPQPQFRSPPQPQPQPQPGKRPPPPDDRRHN